MSSSGYPSDLTDQEWAHLAPLLPAARPGGRPRSVDLRAIVDGIGYLVHTGCPWRGRPPGSIPREYGPWPPSTTTIAPGASTEHGSASMPDCASGCACGPGGADTECRHHRQPERADHRAGRPARFRRRQESQRAQARVPSGQFLVDAIGLVLKAVVHPADVHDREGGKLVLGSLGEQFPHLVHVWADQGYAGAFPGWAKAHTGIDVEVVYPWWRQIKRYAPEMLEELGYRPGFNVLPRRWVVEPAPLGRIRVAGTVSAAGQGLRAAARDERGDGVSGGHPAPAPAARMSAVCTLLIHPLERVWCKVLART